MKTDSCILWFRQDLRLQDNLALQAAMKTGLPIYCIYIWDKTTPSLLQWGGASQWWLYHSLHSLNKSLEKHGNKLLFFSGDPFEILPKLMDKIQAKAIFWNRCYDAHSLARDKKLKLQLGAHTFNSHLLFEPWTIQTQAGQPYKIFTAFWKKGCIRSNIHWPQSFAIPKAIPMPTYFPHSESLDSWHFTPTKPDWAKQFLTYWQPGESFAHQRLHDFVEHKLSHYQEGRNFPAQEYVSRLSPSLHFGEIAPWRIWQVLEETFHNNKKLNSGNIEHFQNELGWREFSYHLLYHFPSLATENFHKKFDNFPWQKNQPLLHAWQRGETGYPLIDAGMRQLWQTGWMHNRVRMITASFLIKDLRIDWRIGERWFWDTLVDADIANNSASWQWVAGSGTDAAPYFRIFNPITQSQKFDPTGEYIRRWVPELAALDNKSIHFPTEKVKNYPTPIVDHALAREAALTAFKHL